MKYKFLALIILFVSTLTNATQFKLGEHYTEVKTTFKTEKSIIEFFSFYCPHCYKQEPIINNLIANLPSDIIFNKNHVDGMPGKNLEIEQALTKALITADILNVNQHITPAIFSYIHKNKANLNSIKDIKNIFLLQGVEEKYFDKTFNSFAVKTRFNKAQLKTAALRKQGVTTVPTVIINGKYKVETHKISNQTQYNALVTYLLNKANDKP